MNIICTICNFRPDLLEIQVALCRKLCTEPFDFVVGCQNKSKKIRIAIKKVADMYNLRTQGIRDAKYELGFNAFTRSLNADRIIFLEEDLMPTLPFGFDGPVPAARRFSGQFVKTMRRWSGEMPDKFLYEIPSYRALKADQLPAHWPQLIIDKYDTFQSSLGCEIIDKHWFHYDKATKKHTRWFMEAKDWITWELGKSFGIKLPDETFTRFSEEY